MQILCRDLLPIVVASVLSLHASASDASSAHHLSDEYAFLRVAAHDVPAKAYRAGLGKTADMPHMVEDPVHTNERTFWPPDQGNGLVAWLFAALFVILIALVPCILHVTAQGFGFPGMIVVIEGICLVVWLVLGLFMFTQVFNFSSPHFGDSLRTLTLVEAVYLFAQIITTVGYGDIIPATIGGQLFIGCFVFCAIMLIAGMVSEISSLILSRAERRVALAVEEASNHLRAHDGRTVIGHTSGPSLKPVLVSMVCFTACVTAGTCFYSMYPGEGKTPGQGLHMSIITLTTVGFGAFTAETEAGMVFGAFWMLIGVAALAAVVASFTEFMVAMKDREKPTQKEHDADEILHEELKDHDGRIDKLHYLQYALLKYNIASKQQVAAILKQFDALDEDREGSISVQKLEELASPHGSPGVLHRPVNRSARPNARLQHHEQP